MEKELTPEEKSTVWCVIFMGILILLFAPIISHFLIDKETAERMALISFAFTLLLCIGIPSYLKLEKGDA